MQKINVISIFRAHIDTLRGEDGKLLRDDIIVFYVFPSFLAILIYVLNWEVPDKVLELSISVFSIFAALLLSVQVALYSVSFREISPPEDKKKHRSYEEMKSVRKSLIKELNGNISYLVLLSIVTVTITLLLFFVSGPRIFGSALASALYLHFFLTLMMVVKRANIVFSREYENPDF